MATATPATSYKNPLDYTVKTYSKEGEKDVSVPFLGNVAQTQIPTGFKEKQQTASMLSAGLTSTDVSAQSIITQEPTLAAAPTTKRQTQTILEKEGVKGAKDVLGAYYFQKPKEVLEAQGITEAQDILAGERMEQERIRKIGQDRLAEMQKRLAAEEEEFKLQNLEKEYISKLDANNFKFSQALYETKFGVLDLDKAKIDWNYNVSYTNPTTNKTSRATLYTNLDIAGEKYAYIPAEYLVKGVQSGDRQFYNTAFLKEAHWDKFLSKAQAINAEELGAIAGGALKNYENVNLGTGFLVKRSDIAELLPENSSRNSAVGTGLNQGKITGLAYHPTRKELVYVTSPQQQAKVSYIHYNNTTGGGVTRSEWIEYKDTPFGKIVRSVPIIGPAAVNFATDLSKEFSKIPFAPEIALAVTGNPALYGSLKALQIAGTGAPLEDRVSGGVKAFALASIPLDSVAGSVTDALYKGGNGMITNPTFAKAAGSAITHATFQGALAAAEGRDINKAMLEGAIGGSASATSTEITNKIFGGSEKVTAIAKSVNLSPKQFEKIFVGATITGSIAAVNGKDFATEFGNALIVNGLSTAAANTVVKSLKDNNLSKDQLNTIGKSVQTLVTASARAAIRGESIQEALANAGKAVATRYVAGQALKAASAEIKPKA